MKKDPREMGTLCNQCPLFNASKFEPVLGEIPDNPKGILVGEGPGSEEVTYGRPFVGATGRELEKSLALVGLKRAELAVVNSTCCKPGPDDGPDTRARAAKCCRPALTKQLEGIERLPKFLMGTSAVTSFMPIVKGGVDVMRGFVREKENAIISWHPTYAYFRNPYAWAAFETDLARFKRLIDGTLKPGPRRITTSPTVEDLQGLIAQAAGVIAVDIETAPIDVLQPWTGKDPTRAVLRSIGFGTEHEALSFTWEDASLALQRKTKEILEDPTITKVGQNFFWFDGRVLKRYGINTVNIEDTRDLRCALSATSELSLRYLASLYTDFPPFKEMENYDDK